MSVTGQGRRTGQGAIFLCAVLWSTSGLFIKLVDWNPVVIAGTRSFVAALFLLALRLFVRGTSARLPEAPGGAGDPRKKQDRFFMAAAGLAYAFTMITFVIANKYTASANAILLQYSAPVWAAVLGWIVAKEKPHWAHWMALALVFFGMFLFFRNGLGPGGMRGDLLAVISGVAFGAHSVFLRMIKHGGTAGAMLLAHVSCALFCAPFLFLFPPRFTPAAAGAILFMGTV